MRAFVTALCLLLCISSVPGSAADANGPLPAAGAAGIKQAQAGGDNRTLYIVGAGTLLAIGALIAVVNKGGTDQACFAISSGCPPFPFPPTTTTTTMTTSTLP